MPYFYEERPYRVLAIDDDEGVRRLYGRILGATFDIGTADSCAAARVLLETEAGYDALILDLGMAGEDTVTFWEWILQEHPRLAGRTLIISGAPDRPAWASIVRARGGWVMCKPVNPWELRDRLRDLVDATAGQGEPGDGGRAGGEEEQ